MAINSIVVNVADAARASNIIPQQGCSYVIFSSRRSLNFDKLPIDVTRSIQECLLPSVTQGGSKMTRRGAHFNDVEDELLNGQPRGFQI